MCWSHQRYGGTNDWRERERPVPEHMRGDVRASDADRQRVIDQLRVHTADGRLTLDEFETRVSDVWAATTHADLRGVLADLPAPEGVRPARRTWAGVGVPAPLLIAALVLAGSLLLGHFAWWLIPVGLVVFGGGCGGHRVTGHEERVAARDETLISA